MRITRITTSFFALLAAVIARHAFAQTPPATINLAPSTTTSSSAFGAMLGVHETTSGSVLINDAGRRQLVLLDSQLRMASLVLDSAASTDRYYGPRPSSFISYHPDTILFIDAVAQSLVAIDGRGAVAGVRSVPRPRDISALGASQVYADARGRLVYRGLQVSTAGGRALGATGSLQAPDSAPIVRADLDSRTIDTLARVKLATPFRMRLDATPDGKGRLVLVVDAVQIIDEYAMLPDGTIAIARGQDYHLEFIRPDGARTAGPKLPFDWRRISDEEKRQLADSARRAAELSLRSARPASSAMAGTTFGGAGDAAAAGGSGAGGVSGSGDGQRVVMTNPRLGGTAAIVQSGADPGTGPLVPVIELPPLKDMPDYFPVLRSGAMRVDLDGNIWILPSTTSQSVGGGLVYDVVNQHGLLERRVRVPAGRSIVGFGRSAVYLMVGDRTNGFHLERAPLRQGNGR